MAARSTARCLVTWAAATLLAAVALRWVAPDLRDLLALLADPVGDGSRPAAPLADWLTRIAATAVALCASWGWWVTTVVVGQALTGRERAVHGVPVRARRVVLVACGLLVAGTASPVVASAPLVDDGGREGPRSERVVGPQALDGLPLPDRAEGPSAAQAVALAVVARRADATPPPTERAPARRTPVHVVRDGESLWSIAAAAWTRATGTPPTAAEVAAYWPQVYAASRDLVGDDPDLLLPGGTVRLPPAPTTTHASPDREDPR